ncbi:hypothetical protein NIES4074_45720 [Cylindrospermum sp. NIES-4074]|nr:hypothetical protein NIES4074_45720 [Cylindrospermum sp. NIES-4074]
MTDLHLASNGQIRQQKNTVAIFCDLQNVSSLTKFASLVVKFAESQGTVSCKKIYYNSQRKNEIHAKNKLETVGFECVDVPDSSENSADHRLMADCVKLFTPKPLPSPNIIVLVLGDWDFAGLICVLKSLGKKVIVFAQRGSASPKLIKLVGAHNFHFIDELPELVGKKAVESQIDYNEAMECLTEAIKTALSQGKRTGLGYINNLMCELFPKYQGSSSIHTPSGKKFKNFGEFVNAAVKSGNVRRQHQELFLIDLDRITA